MGTGDLHRRRTALARGASACAGALALCAVCAGVLTNLAQARRPSDDLAPAAVAQPGAAAAATRAGSPIAPAHPPAVASLERCVTTADQVERYATFAGRMVALPGSTGMAMRIDLEERVPGQLYFHRVEEAGALDVGAWRTSEPGVKIFKDVKQVSNLGTALEYRAVVHFRWMSSRETVLKREVLRTAICRQPAHAGQVGG